MSTGTKGVRGWGKVVNNKRIVEKPVRNVLDLYPTPAEATRAMCTCSSQL